jgi:glycosyltransferase involved in cell wall biosynthesis
MKFAIDLLWLRHNKVGGTESYIKNLLIGFMMLKDDFQIYLIVSEDNQDTFEEYLKDSRFNKILCNIRSANIANRIIWENFNLGKLLKKHDINLCFEPVYSKPILLSKGIKFVTTIHDLQAWHYPEYQSKLRVIWLKISWKNSIKTSNRVIATTEFVREDIISRYGNPDKIINIHIPIQIDINEVVSFDEINKLYNIKAKEFYYTVSSLLPHKNLKTLIQVMKVIKDKNINLPNRLLISGIGGKEKGDLLQLIHESGLTDNIVLTGFVDNKIRNTLYKNCKAFLFPSIFEGFGMPPVEAMAFGGDVITTKKTSLYEVTQGLAKYVDDPYDVDEWIDEMIKPNETDEKIKTDEYDVKYIADKYLKCFSEVIKRN